jgi:hypothetical protein
MLIVLLGAVAVGLLGGPADELPGTLGEELLGGVGGVEGCVEGCVDGGEADGAVDEVLGGGGGPPLLPVTVI